MSEEALRQSGAEAEGRIVDYEITGVAPEIMGIGPVPAFQAALQRSESKLSDYALFEVNEAFAPQYLAVEKELGLPRDATNVDGPVRRSERSK